MEGGQTKVASQVYFRMQKALVKYAWNTSNFSETITKGWSNFVIVGAVFQYIKMHKLWDQLALGDHE